MIEDLAGKVKLLESGEDLGAPGSKLLSEEVVIKAPGSHHCFLAYLVVILVSMCIHEETLCHPLCNSVAFVTSLYRNI